MSDGNSSTLAGQAVYNPWVLRIYDAWVLGVSCSFIWQCSAQQLLHHYDRCLGRRHLDVGVGTGYFLGRARFPANAEVTLFDLNQNSLHYAASRAGRYAPHCVHGDVLQKNDIPAGPFDSIGLNFLFHCLPSGGAGKWRALDHLLPSLAPGGVLFGSTILGAPHAPRWSQRRLMAAYNARGIFSNSEDDRAALEAALRSRFSSVEITQRGVVALFSARR